MRAATFIIQLYSGQVVSLRCGNVVTEPGGPHVVATLAQAASAAYYLESQRSFRHPNEYYTAGEEPDGVWFNPLGLFGLVDGGKVDSSDFHRLYNGFAPEQRWQADAERRQRAPFSGSGHDL